MTIEPHSTSAVQHPPTGSARDIPGSAEIRQRMRSRAEAMVHHARLAPPVDANRLEALARQGLAEMRLPDRWGPFFAVLLHNAIWRETMAGVPHDRRLLLLPQCLRNREDCPATTDAAGLHCTGCGGCVIGRAREESQRLGMICLVAEGTPMVLGLLATGKVRAVLGVGCVESLQRVFPAMQAAGVPALAVPLLRDGCDRTAVDEDWLWEAMYLSGEEAPRPGDLTRIGRDVAGWFTPESLAERIPGQDPATRLGLAELAGAGKRLRPTLAVGAWEAITGRTEPTDNVRRMAVAVECFHKASLVHDDIEDDDADRNGKPALHVREGLAQAVNTGDLLIGLGYRLLGGLELSAELRLRSLAVAAAAHSRLCIGQGRELNWLARPSRLEVADVLEIAAGKTAPAFEVALRLGVLAAGRDDRDEPLNTAARDFAEALGQAYQLRDDLQDSADLPAGRLTMLAALAEREAPGEIAAALADWWRGGLRGDEACRALQAWATGPVVSGRAEAMRAELLERAERALLRVDPPGLRALLRAVLQRTQAGAGALRCCCGS